VIAVHVRDEYPCDFAVTQVTPHELVLRGFAAVEQPDLIRETQGWEWERREVSALQGQTLCPWI